MDWALDAPVPWKAEAATRAGTVHLADDLDQLTEVAAALSTKRVPERPFILFGQQSMADPTRSPAGTETAWAYAHVPRDPKPIDHSGTWDRSESDRFADRMPTPGYLFVGASESLLRITDRFALHELDGAFVYVKRR